MTCSHQPPPCAHRQAGSLEDSGEYSLLSDRQRECVCPETVQLLTIHVPINPAGPLLRANSSVMAEASAGPEAVSYLMGKEGPDVSSLPGMKNSEYPTT